MKTMSCHKRSRLRCLGVALVGTWFLAAATVAGEAELVSMQTPWRVWMVTGASVERDAGGQLVVIGRRGKPPLDAGSAGLSPLPPPTWRDSGFEDQTWGRYGGQELRRWAGPYGLHYDYRDPGRTENPALLCLRTRFGVADPSRATDVQITVEYLGGVVVTMNGVEVGRGHLPAGRLEPQTLAADYPLEAYTMEDGTTPLPTLQKGNAVPDAGLAARYRTRIRSLTVSVPSRLLVKGANVLALELHRSLILGPLSGNRFTWWHIGVGEVKVSSASGAGVIAYSEALKGTQVWNAQSVEQITDSLQPVRSLDRGAEGISPRGAMMQGLAVGNPFDPLWPVRILAPCNGAGTGLAVLTDLAGLRGVRGRVSKLSGPGGAALPVTGVRVRYARRGFLHWCDELVEEPPDGAKTVPVWVEAQVPKNQAAGWYAGNLSLQANGKSWAVPLQVFVSGYIAPDPRDFHSVMVTMHSPEALEKTYRVKPYGDEHFRLMEQSLQFAAQVGGKVAFVPVIVGGHMGHETGLIRWVRDGRGMKPDYSLFEKYLDLYVKHCGTPRAISLYVWHLDVAKEAASAYEGSQIPSREYQPKKSIQVTLWDPQTGQTESVPAPNWLTPEADAFWKPLLDGVHEIVVRKRGWPEKTILLGIGSDTRPSVKTGEMFRGWAPYARWDIYSHFSGDPGAGGIGHTFYKGPPLAGSAPGKFIAIGNLEVGLKEIYGYYLLKSDGLEAFTKNGDEYLTATVQRVGPGTQGAPIVYRMQPMIDGRWTRLGIDFWPEPPSMQRSRYHPLIWGATPLWLTWPGPQGPQPTVRLMMIREGLQDFEARLAIAAQLGRLPAERQKPYRELLDDLGRRTPPFGEGPVALLPQTELSYDWQGYVAALHAAAAELAGVKVQANWDAPPKGEGAKEPTR
jgi:hypothetical protein